MSIKRQLAIASTVVSRNRQQTAMPTHGARSASGRIIGRLAVGVLTSSLLLAGTASTASAAPVNTTGKIVRVVDGDTVIARIGGEDHRIRITGLNATELTDYRPGHRKGQCHAVQATRRLEKLVLNKWARITARRESSQSGERDRLRRSLKVKNAEGKWIDPAAVLIREGLALWMPNKIEYLPNRRYATLAAQAAAGRGLWDTDACGVGPAQNAALQVTVNWKGTETVSIRNKGTSPVSLAGWWVRDNSYHGPRGRGYKFPPATTVPPGGTIVLHINGERPNSGGHYYWGLPHNVRLFDKVTGEPTYMADGAYLFDPHGDLRAARQYAPHALIQFP